MQIFGSLIQIDAKLVVSVSVLGKYSQFISVVSFIVVVPSSMCT